MVETLCCHQYVLFKPQQAIREPQNNVREERAQFLELIVNREAVEHSRFKDLREERSGE